MTKLYQVIAWGIPERYIREAGTLDAAPPVSNVQPIYLSFFIHLYILIDPACSSNHGRDLLTERVPREPRSGSIARVTTYIK